MSSATCKTTIRQYTPCRRLQPAGPAVNVYTAQSRPLKRAVCVRAANAALLSTVRRSERFMKAGRLARVHYYHFPYPEALHLAEEFLAYDRQRPVPEICVRYFLGR